MQIKFNRKKVEELRKRYNRAVKDKEKMFLFEESDLLTDYAKYLLIYLDEVIK